jgi:pantoate--beta-alanine ligase
VKIYNNITNLKEYLNSQENIGFVPTMGSLHQGHLSLIKNAILYNDCVVVSIFVNPTQFDNKDDLEKYPKDLNKDIDLIKTLHKNNIVIFAPNAQEIYAKKVKAVHYDFDGLEHQMEGKFRAGHFDGVGTIVKMLFDIVKPKQAYFGEKDFQQLQIIKKLVEKEQLGIEIVPCPIYREKDGLAMSSRNQRLSAEHRKIAPFIYKTLQEAKEKFDTKSATKVTEWVEKQFSENKILELEYFTIANEKNLKTVKRKNKKQKYRAFIAVFAGKIRLIDNIEL